MVLIRKSHNPCPKTWASCLSRQACKPQAYAHCCVGCWAEGPLLPLGVWVCYLLQVCGLGVYWSLCCPHMEAVYQFVCWFFGNRLVLCLSVPAGSLRLAICHTAEDINCRCDRNRACWVTLLAFCHTTEDTNCRWCLATVPAFPLFKDGWVGRVASSFPQQLLSLLFFRKGCCKQSP
jgi:hypothetical protein